MRGIKMPENSAFANWPLFIKILAVTLGAVFALTLTGDIDKEGRIKVSPAVLIKTVFSAFLGFLGGDAVIVYFHLQDWPYTTHGLIMMIVSIFGMLVIGILYQTIQLTMFNKRLSEIVLEIKEVFKAILK